MAQWWRIRLPVQEIQERRVWSLGEEDPLVREMATHSSILAWRIPQTEEIAGLHSSQSCRVGHNWATEQQQQHNIIYTYTHTYLDRKLHFPLPVLMKGKQLGVGNFRPISELGWESASDWKRKNSFLTKMVRRWWGLTSPPPALGCQILTAWKLREMLD